MIKANKEGQRKTPILRFKGFTDDWEQRKLQNQVQFFSGLTYSPNDVKSVGTFVIRSSNIKDNTLVSADNVYVNPNIANSEPVKKDDVIMVVRNGSKSLIGKHALVTRKINNTVIGAFMTGIRSSTPYFLDALLDTINFKKEIYKNLGATINQITVVNLRKMTFKVPNESEKFKIGNLFKKLNYLLVLYERKLKLLSQVKKYFLDNLFAEKEYPNLRFKGFTDAWKQRELREIAKKRTEKNRNLLTNNVLSNSAIYGIVKQTEYFNKSIANNIQNYYLVYENDFVYNPRISNNAPFGPISRNKLNELGVMSPLYLVFYFSTKSLSDYLEIYFKSSKWHKFMYMSGNSGARSDRFAIKDNDFFRMKIKMPHSKDEINKIYKFNILLYKLLTLYENKQQYLTEIKNTLLNTMFI